MKKLIEKVQFVRDDLKDEYKGEPEWIKDLMSILKKYKRPKKSLFSEFIVGVKFGHTIKKHKDQYKGFIGLSVLGKNLKSKKDKRPDYESGHAKKFFQDLLKIMKKYGITRTLTDRMSKGHKRYLKNTANDPVFSRLIVVKGSKKRY